jgi:predicted O-methyltransferase YrrM
MNDTITFNTETQAFGMQQPMSKCSGYGLGEMIKDMQSPKGLEIGCDIGDTSNFLLDVNPSLHLTSIDPYTNYVDWNGNQLNEREELFQRAMHRLEGYSNRFDLVRQTSDEACSLFDTEQFDFIFIDGLHTYEQLTKDCANYYSKLKSGGIFAGHDFTAIEGVNRAAKEFAAQTGREIHLTEKDVWYWIK